jgi:hypothetical protein
MARTKQQPRHFSPNLGYHRMAVIAMEHHRARLEMERVCAETTLILKEQMSENVHRKAVSCSIILLVCVE